MSDIPQREDIDAARDAMVEAITAWATAVSAGEAVLTSWYVIAESTGFNDDGTRFSHLLQDWEATTVQQLGLLDYAQQRAGQRIFEDDDTEEDGE